MILSLCNCNLFKQSYAYITCSRKSHAESSSYTEVDAVAFCSIYIQGRIKALRGARPIPNSSGGYIYTGVGKIGDFRRKSPFIPETVRDMPGNNPKHFFTLFMRQTIDYCLHISLTLLSAGPLKPRGPRPWPIGMCLNPALHMS